MCYIGILSTFCDNHGPSVLMATTITNDIENEVVNITKDLNEDPTVNCEYCSSFKHPGMPCLATFENNVCFVSSRSASSSVVDNKKIKHISMRCLSCEVVEDNHFGIWIDNHLLGGTTCYNFSVFDEKARGNRRIFSLAIAAISPSSTSILSSNMIAPRLEHISLEISKDQTNLSLVGQDRQKALTFIHIRISQLILQLCFEVDEFVRLSSTSTSSFNVDISRKKLDLDVIKKFIMMHKMDNNKTFSHFLTDYFMGECCVLELEKMEDAEKIKDFLDFFSFNSKTRLSADISENKLIINDEDGKIPKKIITTIVPSCDNIVDCDQTKGGLSIVKDIVQTFKNDLSKEATQIKLDLIRREYFGLLKNGGVSRITTSKGLTEIDIRWLQNLKLYN